MPLVEDISEPKRLELAREKLIYELKRALEQVKLSGAFCRFVHPAKKSGMIRATGTR